MDELIQYIRFNVYADRLPERLHPEYASFIDSLQILESQEVPAVVTNLVVLPRRDWRERSEFLNLYAFGSFRSQVRTIMRLYPLLIEAYLQSGILPIVQPIPRHTWAGMVSSEAPTVRRLARKGLLAFARDSER